MISTITKVLIRLLGGGSVEVLKREGRSQEEASWNKWHLN